jgi:hypothetical protein
MLIKILSIFGKINLFFSPFGMFIQDEDWDTDTYPFLTYAKDVLNQVSIL